MTLVFLPLAKKIEQKSLKKINKWMKKTTTNKQTNIKWMYSLLVYHEARESVIR